MPVNRNKKRLAVLIDAENVSGRFSQVLFRQIDTLGKAHVRRIYGDFSGSRHKGWNDAVRSLAIDQRQQHAITPGKNASDIAIVIDAMDLLHRGRVDGFCLVSSDSDFTMLARRLREDGLDVYGWGERKAPKAFRGACDSFYFLDGLLDAESGETSVAAPSTRVMAKKQEGRSS